MLYMRYIVPKDIVRKTKITLIFNSPKNYLNYCFIELCNTHYKTLNKYSHIKHKIKK